MDSRRNSPRRLGVPTLTALLAGSALVLSPVGPPTASAAAGDYSYAHAQFLQGSLLDEIDLSAIVEVEGEEAESEGLANDGPHYNTLDLELLDAINLDLGGSLGSIPLDTGLGVVGQYANATRDGFSLAGAGLITNNGVVRTPDGPPPQPMEFALTDLLPVGAIADLRLTVDAATATAEQTGGAAPDRDYELDDLFLVIESPALSGITTELASPTGPIAEIDTALG